MTDWALVVHRDGQAVTGPVPCDDWAAASAVAELLASWLGGPISVASAVVAARPAPQDH